MLRKCVVLHLALAWGAVACADDALRFCILDRVGHRWTNELVTFERILPEDIAAAPDLRGQDGRPVPVQVRPAGRTNENRYEIAFVVDDLPPNASLTYELRAGRPTGQSLVAERADGALILDAGPVAARVPAPDPPLASGRPIEEMKAPLLAVRGRSKRWLGAGRFRGDTLVTRYRSELAADGPVYAESRTTCVFSEGRYSATVRLVRGQDAIFIREEYDVPDTFTRRAYLTFDLSAGLEPNRFVGEIRKWRVRTDERETILGPDFQIDFDENRREVSVLGYLNWWPETAMRATFYRAGDPTHDAVSILPARIGRWRNPTPLHVTTAPNHQVTLELPIFFDNAFGGVEFDSPYYTGRLEEGWPLTATRREWVLHLSTVGEALPIEGPSSVLEATRRYSSLPLDKVKDWTFGGHEGVTYPLLFVEPGSAEQIRERVALNPRWQERLMSGHNLAAAYFVTQDPQVGRDLVFRGDPEDPGEWAWQDMGALQSLRHYVRRLLRAGYLGERWGLTAPNNSRPMLEMIKFDAAMGVEGIDEAVRTEMATLMAFVANVVYDQDWNPTLAGFHRGNVNMPPRQEHHLAVASCVLPKHTLAPAWRARGLAEQEWEMAHMVREGGAWRECPSYQMDAAHLPLFQAAVAMRNSGGPDLFTDPRLKSSWDYLLNLSTPPDARFNVRVLPAFGNGTWLPAPFFGWLACLTRETDPNFSRRMQWMWIEHGRPDWYPFSEFLIDPDLTAEQPGLVSRKYPGFGAILRSGFPSRDEAWVAWHIGENVEHYNYGDQGSFMYYAKGAPLVLHFGSIYFPQFRGAWYFNRVSIGHQEVQPGLFGGTEQFDGIDANYYGRLTDFGRLGAVDYAAGQHRSSRQGLVPDDARTEIPHNQTLPERVIPLHLWTRRMVLVKSLDDQGREDPTGPGYLVIHDDIASEDPLPTEWNLWMWLDVVELAGNRAQCRSPYGVTLDVFMAEPVEPNWTTRDETTAYGPGGGIAEQWSRQNANQPWREKLTNLRGRQKPGCPFLAVLYPRKNDETAPEFTRVADGAGVAIYHSRGMDHVLLAREPLTWREGDRCLNGAAGIIREEGATLSLVLLAPGTISAAGYALEAAGPAGLTVHSGSVEVASGEPHTPVTVRLPNGNKQR